MLLAAGPWYDSGTLWTAAGVLATLLASVIGALLTQRKPRRLLVYTARARKLLAGQSAALLSPDLQLAYHGSPLATPYLVSLSVLAKSRIDIRREDFDGGRPLIFDLGTPIVGVLASSVPGIPGRAGNWFRVSGSSVLVGPTLIRKGQSISLDVLTDSPPKVTYQSDLAGVVVTEERAGDALMRRWKAVATIAIVVVASTATGLLSHYLTSQGRGSAGHVQKGADSGPGVSLVGPQAGNRPGSRSTSEVLTDPSSGGIHSAAYSPDGDYLATGDANGHSYIWSVATQRLVHDIPDQSNQSASLGINAVAFSINGQYFATGDANGTIYLWSRTFAFVASLPDPHSGGIQAIAFSPDNGYLAAGDLNGNVYIWRMATRKLARTLSDPDSHGVYAVAFSESGSYLAAGDGNGHVYIWAHELYGTLTIPNSGGIRAVAFTSDKTGADIAAGAVNGNTYVWIAGSLNLQRKLTVSQAYSVAAVAFSANDQNKYLAVAETDGHLYFWGYSPHGRPDISLQSESPGFSTTGAFTAVAFSPDGRHLAVGTSIGHLYQWDGDF